MRPGKRTSAAPGAEPSFRPLQLRLPGFERFAAGEPRTVLHVHVDEFVVAVELRRRPELRGLPVAVGAAGDPVRRGVVSGASAEAGAYGIHVGTPLRLAARRCPHAVFLPLDVRACRAAAREVEAVLRTFAGAWEIAGWDEAFLEADTDDPLALAVAIQRELLETTGLACSIGIGENKLQARVASRIAEPGGVVRLDAACWHETVGPLCPDVLVGIGPGRGRRLRSLGIERVEQLAAADELMLTAAFGPAVGPELRRRAHGEDQATLVRRRPPSKSHSRAHTFDEDVDDPEAVRDAVVGLAAAVARDLRRRRRLAVRVVVTLRYAPFETHSHAVDTMRSSAERAVLEEAALRALARFDLGPPVRLVGIRAELAAKAPRPRRPRRRPLPGPQPMLEPYLRDAP